jgi:hypothetical protein
MIMLAIANSIDKCSEIRARTLFLAGLRVFAGSEPASSTGRRSMAGLAGALLVCNDGHKVFLQRKELVYVGVLIPCILVVKLPGWRLMRI